MWLPNGFKRNSICCSHRAALKNFIVLINITTFSNFLKIWFYFLRTFFFINVMFLWIFQVVQILTHMRPQFSFSLTRKHPPPLLGLVGLAIALPPPTINELLIDSDMFVTRLSPNFKVIYCEPRSAQRSLE